VFHIASSAEIIQQLHFFNALVCSTTPSNLSVSHF